MPNIVIYLLSFGIEGVILYQYASTLFAPRRRTGIRLVCLCSLYFFLFAVSMFHSTWLNTFMYLLANFVFLITQYRLSMPSALFHSVLLTAIMGICELTIFITSFHNMLLFIIFSKLIFFTMIYICMHFFKDQREPDQRHNHSALLPVFVPLTSVLVMLTFLTLYNTGDIPPVLTVSITLDAIFLLATNLLVFGMNLYNRKKNMEFTEMQLLLQKEANAAEYYQMLLSQNENQNILIHDIKKHLQSIHLLNEKGEQDKISAYIQQLMISSDLKETSRLCGNELLNTILCQYKRQCDKKRIAFHIDIRHGTIDFIADIDLTSLFGNLLDNALEAACSIPEGFIEVSTDRRIHTPFIVITVINSCRKNPFSDPQGSLSTHKPDRRRHGFGIKSIRKTVSKYQGNIKMYYNDDTLTFHTIITIKIPEEER